MTPATRRLYLPGGGSFDLPLPSTFKAVAAPTFDSVLSSCACPSVLVPVLGGLLLGGLATWGLLRLTKS